VILNPVQQARQQLSARQSGVASDPAQRFASLVLQAGSGMPFMAGGMQQLLFTDGVLQLSRVGEGRPASADKTWQATLAQAGIAAEATDDGWILRAAALESVGKDDSGADDE
jgi:general secretion pathway protein L